MPGLPETEVKALARIVGELDYYQLLHLTKDATSRDVKRAYHASSRNFHPDANRHLDDDLRGAVAAISKRIAEAYSVLRDPQRRRSYDDHLAGGGDVRMQLAEAQAAAQNRRAELSGSTPQGRQYYGLVQADLQRDDVDARERAVAAGQLRDHEPVRHLQIGRAHV